MNKETQLLPCPFCGGTTHETCMTEMYEVACHQCKSSTGLYATLAEAEAAWNRRALAPEGFKLVPVEPTEAMLEASWQTCIKRHPEEYIATALANPRNGHIIKARNRYAAMLAASPTANVPPQVNEAAKPLEWAQVEHDPNWFVADACGFRYAAFLHRSDKWRVQISSGYSAEKLQDFRTLDDAKAAAQADYEQRIRSALASPSPGTATAGASDKRTAVLREALLVADEHLTGIENYGGEPAVRARRGRAAIEAALGDQP